MDYRREQCEVILSEITRLIASSSNSDGGWGEQSGKSSDVWSTAEVSDLLNTLSTKLNIHPNIDLSRILVGANTFLANRQNGDNGWGVEPRESDATGTELAMYALAKYDDRKYMINLQRGIDWLENNRNREDAGWSLQGGLAVSSVFCTCFGCIALNSLPDELKSVPVKEGLLKMAEARLKSSRNSDYGWSHITRPDTASTALATAHAIYTLCTVFNHSREYLRPSINWLKKHQNSDGGWGEEEGGTVEATAWTMIALLTLEGIPTINSIHKGIDYLIRSYEKDKGWSNEKGKPVTIWATVDAALALATYIISCKDFGGQKVSLLRRGQTAFLNPPVTVIIAIVPSIILFLLLFTYYVSTLKVALAPYSDVLIVLAAIATILTLIWTLGVYLFKRS